MKKKRDFVKLNEGQYFEKYSKDTVSEIISKLTPIEKVTTLEVLLKELNELINDLETQVYDAHVESLEITIGKLVENKGNIDGMSLIDDTKPAGKLWSKIIYLAPKLHKCKDNMESELLFWKNHNYQLNAKKIQNIEKTENKSEIKHKEFISWQGTETQLIYLIELLINENLLPTYIFDERFSFISKYFVNKKGKPFKPKQLAQAQDNYEQTRTGKPKDADKIEQIIKHITKK